MLVRPLGGAILLLCTTVSALATGASLTNAKRLALGLTPLAPNRLFDESKALTAPKAKRSASPCSGSVVYCDDYQSIGYLFAGDADIEALVQSLGLTDDDSAGGFCDPNPDGLSPSDQWELCCVYNEPDWFGTEYGEGIAFLCTTYP